jgi:ferredoxin
LLILAIELRPAPSDAAAPPGPPDLTTDVKVDTGMGRFGILPYEVLDLLRGLRTLPGLRLEGLFTHLSTADTTDRDYVLRQLASFQAVLKEVRQAGFAIPLTHAPTAQPRSMCPNRIWTWCVRASSCTGCRRCMTFCPFGIDTQLIMSIAKALLIGADREPKLLTMLADMSRRSPDAGGRSERHLRRKTRHYEMSRLV